MRHRVKGKKLNRSKGQRRALYRNLVEALFLHERIKTTLAKAKAIRPIAEELITKARKDDLSSRRLVAAFLPTKKAVKKLFDEIAPRFKDRPGGYIRILKLGPRASDSAKIAIIELVEKGEEVKKKTKVKKKSKSEKKIKKEKNEKK